MKARHRKHRIPTRRRPFKYWEWTIEPVQDLVCQHGLDVEAELARVLQEEIWKGIEAETGMTQAMYDQQIVDRLVELAAEHGLKPVFAK